MSYKVLLNIRTGYHIICYAELSPIITYYNINYYPDSSLPMIKEEWEDVTKLFSFKEIPTSSSWKDIFIANNGYFSPLATKNSHNYLK